MAESEAVDRCRSLPDSGAGRAQDRREEAVAWATWLSALWIMALLLCAAAVAYLMMIYAAFVVEAVGGERSGGAATPLRSAHLSSRPESLLRQGFSWRAASHRLWLDRFQRRVRPGSSA